MDKTAIVIIDTHGGYQNVNEWLFTNRKKNTGRDYNYISPNILNNLNIIKINKIGPGVCAFGNRRQVEKLLNNILFNKRSLLNKKKTIGEMATYIQRKLREQDNQYKSVKACKKEKKDIVDIINYEIQQHDNWDESEQKRYEENIKTCNRKRHRINKIVIGENYDTILNKIYQYQYKERDPLRENQNNYYGYAVTALIRANNSSKFKEIKDFTKDIEHEYDTGFVEFSLEELIKYLKKLKVKNILIVDLSCNDIDYDLLDSLGITKEFITEHKIKRNNTIKSCNCKNFSFFGGKKKFTRKNRK